MTHETRPAPLVPAEVDLRDFAFMPLDIVRLFGSRFHAIANDAEWRAGVTLWAKSFHQVPAASLPNDDIELCRLSELGRDMKAWRKVRAVAMHGWVLCSDGRFYHPTVAEKANEAWRRKEIQRERARKGNAARWGAGDHSGDESGTRKGSPEKPPGRPNGVPDESNKDSFKDSQSESLKDSQSDSLKDRKGQGQGQGQGNQGAPPAVGSTYGGGELPPLPDQPTEIAHWSNWLSRRGMPWQALRSEKSRTHMAGWIAEGLTWEQMGAVWEAARRELKGGEPTTPAFLTVVLSRMEAAGKRPTTEAEDRQAVFGHA